MCVSMCVFKLFKGEGEVCACVCKLVKRVVLGGEL